MTVLFADTGYWTALWNPADRLRDKVLTVSATLSTVAIVTTQLVLIEALDFMAGMGEFRRRFAAQMVRRLEDTPGVEIVALTDTRFRTAVERYAARPDQRWSLTDCSSFLVMEERGITAALAYDRDFEQAGFTALLREDAR